MKFTYNIADVAPYINWAYFYHAWGTASHGHQATAEQNRLLGEADERLARYADRYHTHALFLLADAYSEQDDIVLSGYYEGERSVESEERLPMLRQQQADSEYLCLADFIAPRTPHDTSLSCKSPSPLSSKIGLFATTVDPALEHDFQAAADPYERMMMQLLADRLAEATAELLHLDVRRRLWGYAPDEHLTMAELHRERFQGIRPAVGYPSLPDVSLNFVLSRLLGFSQIGISLTPAGAMRPHASVSGLMLASPDAHYFAVGPIGRDQLADYARRRRLPVELVRKFLATNLVEDLRD